MSIMSITISRLRKMAGIGPIVIFVNLLFMIAVGCINYYIFPGLTFSSIIALAAGIILILAAFLMIIAANLQIHKALNEGRLLTSGVYGLVRHPLYSAFTLLFLPGVWLISGMWLLILAPIFGYLLLLLILPIEEKMCEKSFGVEYTKYKANVGALFPKVLK